MRYLMLFALLWLPAQSALADDPAQDDEALRAWPAVHLKANAHRGDLLPCLVESSVGGLVKVVALPDGVKRPLDKRWVQISCLTVRHDQVRIALHFARGELARVSEFGYRSRIEIEVVGSYVDRAGVTAHLNPEHYRPPTVVAIYRRVLAQPEFAIGHFSAEPNSLAQALFDETPWIGKSSECKAERVSIEMAAATDPWAAPFRTPDWRPRYLAVDCPTLDAIRVFVPPGRVQEAARVGRGTRFKMIVLGFYDPSDGSRVSSLGGGIAARFDGIVADPIAEPRPEVMSLFDDRALAPSPFICTAVRVGMPVPVTAREINDAARFADGVAPVWQELWCTGSPDQRGLAGTVDLFFPPGRASESARIDYYSDVRVILRGVSDHGHLLAEFDGFAKKDPVLRSSPYRWFAEPETWLGRAVHCSRASYNYDMGESFAVDHFRLAVEAGRRIPLTCNGMNATTHYHRLHVLFDRHVTALPNEIDLLLQGYVGSQLHARPTISDHPPPDDPEVDR